MAEKSGLRKAINRAFTAGNAKPAITVGGTSLKLYQTSRIPSTASGSYVLFEVLIGPPDRFFGGNKQVGGQVIFVLNVDAKDNISLDEVADAIDAKIADDILVDSTSNTTYSLDSSYMEGVTHDSNNPDSVRTRVLIDFTYFK